MPRPLARYFDLTFFAPIGLLSLVIEQWPAWTKQAARNRQAVINRIQLAQLGARAARDNAQQRPVAASPAVSRSKRRSRPVKVAPETSGGARDLPISDYESLAATHVVDRLRTLRPDELEQVREFEQAHRARRTVLAMIEQLQESAT